jgi:hypothetical protein
MRLSATSLLLCLALCAGTMPAMAQSMSGLSLRDDLSKTATLGSKPAASQEMGPFSMRRWTFPDGNDLAVTARRADGRIVYLESSWGGRVPGSPTDFPGVNFGETTLADLRRMMGSNGFSYASRTMFETSEGIGTSNSYEIAGAPGAVVTFISLVKNSETDAIRSGKRKLGEVAKVDSVVLADAGYLDGLWGKERRSDPNAKPVRWGGGAGTSTAAPSAASHGNDAVEAFVGALECNSRFKPEVVLEALQKAGAIAAKPAQVGDGIPSFETRTPIVFHGLTATTVEGWNQQGRLFSRGPGTAPPIHVGITVVGDEKQVTETLRRNGIPVSPYVEGKPFLYVTGADYFAPGLTAKYRDRKLSSVICTVN